jgi:hypothetical protein
MTLAESIIEDADLKWLVGLGFAVGHGPHLAPGGPERCGDGQVNLVERRGLRPNSRGNGRIILVF